MKGYITQVSFVNVRLYVVIYAIYFGSRKMPFINTLLIFSFLFFIFFAIYHRMHLTILSPRMSTFFFSFVVDFFFIDVRSQRSLLLLLLLTSFFALVILVIMPIFSGSYIYIIILLAFTPLIISLNGMISSFLTY